MPEKKLNEVFELRERFPKGAVARIKGTAGQTINGEFSPNGITGIVSSVEEGRVYLAYRIPGKSLRHDKAESVIFDFKPEELEIVDS